MDSESIVKVTVRGGVMEEFSNIQLQICGKRLESNYIGLCHDEDPEVRNVAFFVVRRSSFDQTWNCGGRGWDAVM